MLTPFQSASLQSAFVENRIQNTLYLPKIDFVLKF